MRLSEWAWTGADRAAHEGKRGGLCWGEQRKRLLTLLGNEMQLPFDVFFFSGTGAGRPYSFAKSETIFVFAQVSKTPACVVNECCWSVVEIRVCVRQRSGIRRPRRLIDDRNAAFECGMWIARQRRKRLSSDAILRAECKK